MQQMQHFHLGWLPVRITTATTMAITELLRRLEQLA
jgi:hypothetical protein